MLLTYFLNDFEMVPVAPIITVITFVFTFHMRCISIVRSLYYYYYYYYYDESMNSVFSIETHYGLDGHGFEFRQRQMFFSFPYPSNSTLGPTESYLKWVQVFSPWVKWPGPSVHELQIVPNREK
jgi:hypothetical protein